LIMDPNLISYACIAKGTLVLAEFNSRDAALGAIAAKCLENKPPLHSAFTHTVQSKTYTFLIEGPFVYFAILDENMENSDGLAFLKGVRDAFREFYRGEKRLQRLSSHCFQGEFNPVFRRVSGWGFDHIEGMSSPAGHRMSESGTLQYEYGSPPMKNGLINMGTRSHKKEVKGRGLEFDFDGEISSSSSAGHHHHHHHHHQQHTARKVWKRQVSVVLCADAAICAAMFAIWLWICGGFRCI
ncbi:hypothetical protein M569_01073, partial [Genlisea aurea]